MTQRHGRIVHIVAVVFAILVIAYAFLLLRSQTPFSSVEDLLSVRTDLMRGQPCHVSNETIMGDCSPEEITELQSRARRASSR